MSPRSRAQRPSEGQPAKGGAQAGVGCWPGGEAVAEHLCSEVQPEARSSGVHARTRDWWPSGSLHWRWGILARSKCPCRAGQQAEGAVSTASMWQRAAAWRCVCAAPTHLGALQRQTLLQVGWLDLAPVNLQAGGSDAWQRLIARASLWTRRQAVRGSIPGESTSSPEGHDAHLPRLSSICIRSSTAT